MLTYMTHAFCTLDHLRAVPNLFANEEQESLSPSRAICPVQRVRLPWHQDCGTWVLQPPDFPMATQSSTYINIG